MACTCYAVIWHGRCLLTVCTGYQISDNLSADTQTKPLVFRSLFKHNLQCKDNLGSVLPYFVATAMPLQSL